ncbi:hypothetical protein FKM82_015736 [Ascaphus truei]
MEFQPWRDYLQLALVVQEIARERDPPQPLSDRTHLSLTTSDSSASEGRCSNECQTSPDVQDTSTLDQPKLTDGVCNFCKHNGESRNIYNSHALKSPRGAVQCPVLRKYTCPLCGATGDFAHTLKYCPLNQQKNCLYRKSGRNSAGRKVKR